MQKTKAFIPSQIYPRLLKKIELLQASCLERGIDYWAISGFRSWEEQEKLYALGRTVANVDATDANPLGGKVTNARGGQSYHNFGIATDLCPDKDTTRAGLQPDWSAEAYKILGEEAAKVGLEWGGSWKTFKDYPHVQLPLYKVGLKLNDLQRWYQAGGVAHVWSELEKYNW